MQLRRATKWFASLAAVLLLAGFIASLRYQITIRNPGLWRLEISGGSARVSFSGVPGGSTPPGPVQVDAGAHTTPVAWWPRRYRRVGWPAADIPLWLLAAFVAAPTAFMWWPDRPKPAGHCRRCDYDLQGLPPGTGCPECGAA